jgi:hypothetical protein
MYMILLSSFIFSHCAIGLPACRLPAVGQVDKPAADWQPAFREALLHFALGRRGPMAIAHAAERTGDHIAGVTSPAPNPPLS